VSGTSKITTTNGISSNTGTITPDPYGNLPLPSFSGCDYTNYSAKTTVTMNPGVYCGGMQFNAQAAVTMNPGVYFIDQGSLTVNGQASITGAGVTIVFTSSTGGNWPTATINGGASINLTAPTCNPCATNGVVLYGDRNMAVGTVFKLNGGATQNFGGAVYLPKAALTYIGGNSSTGCTQLIADTISFSGTSNLAINCGAYSGVVAFGDPTTTTTTTTAQLPTLTQ
jgi:hypothetical protein